MKRRRRPRKVPASALDDVTLGLKQAADALRERFPATDRPARPEAEVQGEWFGRNPEGAAARSRLHLARRAIDEADWSKPPPAR